MSVFTWAWIAWGVAFAVIEGVALVNSRSGETLSEHVWAWIGVDRTPLRMHTPCDREGCRKPHGATPKWTLRVARTVLLSFLLWLALHLATGGWV
ncbi:MAG TPA: hypothetical protein VIQ30_15485 [Pseudonocardia sp.]